MYPRTGTKVKNWEDRGEVFHVEQCERPGNHRE
jgi:hypothetical protein